jgi:putative transposase
MPKQRYERREPTHEWSQIRPLLKDPVQIHYEILRPIVLFGVSPKERSAETGVSKTTLYAKANLFDQAGMASLLPPTPPPEIPKQDKRTLPPPMHQAIVDAHAEYPGLSLHEIARICYVQFNRRPSHHTIQLMLAEGPSPSRTMRRFPRFDEIADPAERRRVIIRLHAEGWMPLSIAEYLGTSRQTVHSTLRRWVEEQFAGLEDKPHTRKRRALKTDLRAMNAVKRLQENPELGAYRIHTALLQQGINLSPSTCGRILALNRKLYHLQMPVKRGRPKKEMPFKAERRHQYWTTDIRYLDMHQLGGGMIYCISILENFSRSILASAISRQQDPPPTWRCSMPRSASMAFLRSWSATMVGCSARMTLCGSTRHWASRKWKSRSGKPGSHTPNQILMRKEDSPTGISSGRRPGKTCWRPMRSGCSISTTSIISPTNTARMAVIAPQPEPERIYRAFSAVGEMRTITKAGYVGFRDYLLYGEQNMAGERALVNLFQDILTLEYQEQPLARYSVEWQPDEKHLRRAGNARLYDHPYRSAQLPLWEDAAVEWYLILRADPYGPRRKKKRLVFLQMPLFRENDGIGRS